MPKLVPKLFTLDPKTGYIDKYASGENAHDFLKHINHGMYKLINSKFPMDFDGAPVTASDNGLPPLAETESDDANGRVTFNKAADMTLKGFSHSGVSDDDE